MEQNQSFQNADNDLRKSLSMIEFDQEEELVSELRKHNIGLIFIYLSGFGMSIIVLLIFSLLGMWIKNGLSEDLENFSKYWPVAPLFGLVIALFICATTFIRSYIYRHNVIIVTSQKIAQIIYKNIFDRKVSQLGIAEVQDVTVSQTGLLARMMNYGTLVVETSGEQANYTFSFIPNPYQAAKYIVGARERSVIKYGN